MLFWAVILCVAAVFLKETLIAFFWVDYSNKN